MGPLGSDEVRKGLVLLSWSPHRAPSRLPPCEDTERGPRPSVIQEVSLTDIEYAGDLILNFQPPELWGINVWCLSPWCAALCYSSSDSRRQGASWNSRWHWCQGSQGAGPLPDTEGEPRAVEGGRFASGVLAVNSYDNVVSGNLQGAISVGGQQPFLIAGTCIRWGAGEARSPRTQHPDCLVPPISSHLLCVPEVMCARRRSHL